MIEAEQVEQDRMKWRRDIGNRIFILVVWEFQLGARGMVPVQHIITTDLNQAACELWKLFAAGCPDHMQLLSLPNGHGGPQVYHIMDDETLRSGQWPATPDDVKENALYAKRARERFEGRDDAPIIVVPPGTTVLTAFETAFPEREPNAFKITVNWRPCPRATSQLGLGDRMLITEMGPQGPATLDELELDEPAQVRVHCMEVRDENGS